MTIAPAVLVTDHGPIRLLTLNRPHRRNALDLDDRRDLIVAMGEAQTASDCRIIVLVGAEGVFCAGGDIASMSQDEDIARIRLAVVNDIARTLIGSPKPVIAAVEGGAFGLGLSIAAACDYVVAADDARFVASFSKLGLVADTGLFWSLSRRVGAGRAREMILFGNEVDAQEAHRVGLVSEVVPPAKVLATALERGHTFAALSLGAMAGTKEISNLADQDLESILEAEAEVQVRLLGTDDFAEGRAAFLERRPPNFVR